MSNIWRRGEHSPRYPRLCWQVLCQQPAGVQGRAYVPSIYWVQRIQPSSQDPAAAKMATRAMQQWKKWKKGWILVLITATGSPDLFCTH